MKIEALLLPILCALAVGALVVLALFHKRRGPQGPPEVPLHPLLEDAFALYVAGSADIERLDMFARQHPEATADVLVAFSSAVNGEGRERLGELAVSLALVHRWCEDALLQDPERRRRAYARLESVAGYAPAHRIAEHILKLGLQDHDDRIRVAAARALASSGVPEQITAIFEFALGESASNRQALASALRPHANGLFGPAVAEALENPEEERVLAALEILDCWECAINLRDLSGPAGHPSSTVRTKTMSLLPRAPITCQNRDVLLAGLEDKDASVSIAAASAAADLKLSAAVPGLQRCLLRGDERLTIMASHALAELPDANDVRTGVSGSDGNAN